MLRKKNGLDYKNIDENVDATNWIKALFRQEHEKRRINHGTNQGVNAVKT